MKDALQSEANRLVNRMREFYAIHPLCLAEGYNHSAYDEMYSSPTAIYNAVLEEAKKTCEDAMEASGESMPPDARWAYYNQPFARNAARKELINKLEKLKVKP